MSIFEKELTPEEQRRKKIAELIYLIRFNNRIKLDEDYGFRTRDFAEDESFRRALTYGIIDTFSRGKLDLS